MCRDDGGGGLHNLFIHMLLPKYSKTYIDSNSLNHIMHDKHEIREKKN